MNIRILTNPKLTRDGALSEPPILVFRPLQDTNGDDLEYGLNVPARAHIGYKLLYDSPRDDCDGDDYSLLIAEVIVPPDAIVFRAANDDLRTDEYTIASITDMSTGKKCDSGWAPCYPTLYEVGKRYTEYDIDIISADPCKCGLHFYLTRDDVIRGFMWEIFEYACIHDDRILAGRVLRYGADATWGLWGACRRGNRELTKWLIWNGADDWNVGLVGACRGGHHDLIKLMITRGATSCECGHTIDEHLEQCDAVREAA